MKKTVHHFVARARDGLWPLKARPQACELWLQIGARFQADLLAGILMPNHLHLAIITAKPARVRADLGVLLRSFTRRHFPGRSVWSPQPTERSEVGTKPQKIARVIRYIHLNPCRARLTDNPWLWEFSTIRDHSKHSLSHWIRDEQIEKWLGQSAQTWQSQHESFVQLDSHVKPDALNSFLSTRGFESITRRELEKAITLQLHCTEETLHKRGPERDLLARAILTQSECLSPLNHLSRELGISRGRLGLLQRDPLNERTKRLLAMSVALITGSQRG